MMTAAQKEAVGQILEKRVAALRLGGEVTQQNIERLVRHRTLQTLTKTWPQKSSDVGWAWVAAQQELGKLTGLERHRPGRNGAREGSWRMQAMMRSGWIERGKGGLRERDLNLMRAMERVYRNLQTMTTRSEPSGWSGGETGTGSEGELPPLAVTAKVMRRLWMSQKSGFRGQGGKRAFWATIGIMAARGMIEGDVGRSPEEGDWLELAARLTGQQMKVVPMLQRVGSMGAKEVLRLYVDLGAATQSSRRAATGVGLHYLGIDTREWVYSAAEKTWVQNMVLDYTLLTPEELWMEVEAQVRAKAGWQGAMVPAVIWASPPCHTYSIVDTINIRRGCNYRNHRSAWKPPVGGNTRYSREAKASDMLVRHLLKVFAFFWEGWRVAWFMENPVGNLQHRPFVVHMKLRNKKHRVNYCAYRGYYKKPTHLWSNIRWVPRGTTGTGTCCNRCEKGKVGSKGRWVHKYAIAQSSSQAMGGLGRRARKEEVPLLLHQELLQNYQYKL